ncbi:MAG: hypothetical protein CMO80_05460 [Verrucomicrobiales bacterium]|nr:hypothetical protein [Verrucomicrobiales bacterium]
MDDFPFMNRYSSIWLSLLCASIGCRTYNLHRVDHPEIRAIQAASLKGLPETPIAGESLEKFFAGRGGYVVPATNVIVRTNGYTMRRLNRSGRVVPISMDGYYLTCEHLLSSEPLQLLIGKHLAEPVPGRTVRKFPEADLALVKFDFALMNWFARFNQSPKAKMDVFGAGNTGVSVGQDDIGNGPYQARGQILGLHKRGRNPAYRAIRMTLPSRGA